MCALVCTRGSLSVFLHTADVVFFFCCCFSSVLYTSLEHVDLLSDRICDVRSSKAHRICDSILPFHLISGVQPHCFHFYSPNPDVPTQATCRMEGLSTYRSKQAQEDPLRANQSAFKPEYPQSVDSLYLFLLVRRNWPLSFKLFNTISPSFIPLFLLCRLSLCTGLL